MSRGMKYLSEVLESEEFVKNLRAKAKDTIDANELLDYYNAENIQPRNKSGEVVHSCLIERVHPHHTNGDQTPSASLNAESLLYSCWSFGGFDVLGLLETLEGSREGAARVLAKLSTGESTTSFLEHVKGILESGDVFHIPKYNKNILNAWSVIHPYLLDRGLTEETVVSAQLGYDSTDVRITIPHFWKGDLVGWQKRRLDDPRYPQTVKDEEHKYKNSPSFPKNETLYGYDLADKAKPVVLFEGVMEVLVARQRGYNAVSSFSAWITKKQIEHLRVFPKVTVFYDNDGAGMMGASRVLQFLSRHTKVEVVFSESDRDFDLMTEEEVKSLIENAENSVFAKLRLDKMNLKGKNK